MMNKLAGCGGLRISTTITVRYFCVIVYESNEILEMQVF